MIQRFRGSRGRRILTDALRSQTAVCHDALVAEALARRVFVLQFARGKTLIKQGAADNDLYFLLAGSVAVLVNGREVAIREAGRHVGEMALIDPGARRSASVVAREPVVVAKISEADFSGVANEHPGLWRALAKELTARLRQRSRFLVRPNPKPVLFLGSSRESLSVARALERHIAGDDLVVRLWNCGVFGASHFPIEDLEAQLRAADFAVLVAAPDDRVISRGRESDSPRDNVILELGLFMGALSRERTFLLAPRGIDLKIPTDLLGLTPLSYDPKVKPLSRALVNACGDLRSAIQALGPR